MSAFIPFYKKMEGILSSFAPRGLIGADAPRLLLHSCCAPCSTATIELLSNYFRITVFYFNPNIDEEEEYRLRAEEQRTLLERMNTGNPVSFLEGAYRSDAFLEAVRSHEHDPEGGARCTICYRMRLDETAKQAAENGFDWFCTTLSISPLKDAKRINALGSAAGEMFGISWLWSDFKKKDGFRRSVELSAQLGLYRQDWCGCSFSKR